MTNILPCDIHVCMQYCQTEWEALENGELSNLRAAYNHQLQEQVEIAKQDIVNSLLKQFEVDVNHTCEILLIRNYI